MDNLSKALLSLKQMGVADAKIYTRIGIERGKFYSVKNSQNQQNRTEMYNAILNAYPEINEKVKSAQDTDWKEEYDKLMKKIIEDLTIERERLNKEKEVLQNQVTSLIELMKTKT